MITIQWAMMVRSKLSVQLKTMKILLREAACMGDGFVLCLDAQQYLGDYSGDERDVNKERGRRRSTWSVEVEVRADSQDDEQIPKHGDRWGTWTGRAQTGGAAGLHYQRGPGRRNSEMSVWFSDSMLLICVLENTDMSYYEMDTQTSFV